MLKRVKAALVLAFVSGSPVIAGPAQPLVDATDPTIIAALLQDLGYRAKLELAESGHPVILTTSGGLKYGIYFYGCDAEKKNCTTVTFSSYWTAKERAGPLDMNEWNRTMRFGSAFMDAEGNPTLQMHVNLAHGVSRKNLLDTFEWWDTVLPRFHSFLADPAKPKSRDERRTPPQSSSGRYRGASLAGFRAG